MQIRKGKPPGSGRLARTGVELSREARVRLAWMDFYRHCRNVAHSCRHFNISRQTFYRGQRRYDPYDLATLEERSHCPRRRRQPTWSFPLEEKVLTLRLQFPRWGKDRLAVLLDRACLQRPALDRTREGRTLRSDGRAGSIGGGYSHVFPGIPERLPNRPCQRSPTPQCAHSTPRRLCLDHGQSGERRDKPACCRGCKSPTGKETANPSLP